MSKVVPGYTTAEMDGDFVVFLIGMRINKWWKLHKWVPVFTAMTPMIAELIRHPERGLLKYSTWIGPRGPLMVQYWRSVEHLEEFAKDVRLPHRPAWRKYNQTVGNGGDVGVWHETYMVPAGSYESVYANMPAFGLARAGSHTPVASGTHNSTHRRVTNAAVSS